MKVELNVVLTGKLGHFSLGLMHFLIRKPKENVKYQKNTLYYVMSCKKKNEKVKLIAPTEAQTG